MGIISSIIPCQDPMSKLHTSNFTCENEITQNAFLWEEGERKGIEKSRRQNDMSGVRICSKFTTSIFREREN